MQTRFLISSRGNRGKHILAAEEGQEIDWLYRRITIQKNVWKTNIGSTLTGVYNQKNMNQRRHNYSVMLLLFVCMLTNAFGWAFNGEVFAHELDHQHHVLSLDPTAHLEAHQHASINDDSHLDAATHLCLHAAGQYQPFFFTAPPLVPASTGMETLTVFISGTVPESIPDSPLHPPRNISAS